MNSRMKVYRYEVPLDEGVHRFTLTGKVLHVSSYPDYHDRLSFWAEHRDGATVGTMRAFKAFGTGWEVPADASYIGTAVDAGLGAIWHLYEMASV